MTPEHLADLTALRHALHRAPELSGQERDTAASIVRYLEDYAPDRVLTGLGGHGVAALYDSGKPGPTVLIRCELDALPIHEISDAPYRSAHDGRGHLCGHDGHMVMVAGLARWLATRPLAGGRVVLLFQPAEETGQGAAAVIADPTFADIAPDFALSLHNLPGLPLGQVVLCPGPANCASRGMRIRLSGRTSHAAAPQDGVSPAGAISRLLPALAGLATGGELAPGFKLVTLTHARMGEATFGIAPGEGEIWATLRTLTNDAMRDLVQRAVALVHEVAESERLKVEISYEDIFEACTNHPEAVAILNQASQAAGHPARIADEPMRASEDFGQFSKTAKSAMFWLGSGETSPQLHNPDYDFPDALIPIGMSVFRAAIVAILNREPGNNA